MKKMIVLICLLLIAAPLGAVHAKTYQVSVSQFVEHPALDAVLKGFQDYMRENNLMI